MSKIDIHIFSDAWLEGMCMVAYLNKQDGGKVTFGIGKCRVAPIRNMTVAKLEIQAAVFGVRLREVSLEEHDIEVNRIVHWTESTTVLQLLYASNNNKQPVLRQEYWIIDLRNALRNVKAKRVKCRKQTTGVSQPFMADLQTKYCRNECSFLPTLELTILVSLT